MSLSSVAPTGGRPPLKKKKASLLLPHTTISSLPDDLVLSCLARVSRLYYPTLSLVCKKFRLLLASPELYETRSLLGRTESCLYVCLRLHRGSDPRWFTLCRKPNRNLTNDTTGKKKTRKKKSVRYVLATIPIPHSPPFHCEGVVAVGCNIYAIHGSTFGAPPSSSVSILDCRSHTWHEAPSMRVERTSAHANVFDGKIYVAGGCNDSSNWMEVFDPKTQTWETLCPVPERCIRNIGNSAVIEGEIFMFGNYNGLSYKPKEDRWEMLGWRTPLDIGLPWCSYCVVDNVVYCYSYPNRIQYYDSNVRYWVELTGLKGLPKIPEYIGVKLVCYGRKMVVLWGDNDLPSSRGYRKTKKIWCAVIALEKRNNETILGNVEWVDDDVVTVPSSYEVVCALSATV